MSRPRAVLPRRLLAAATASLALACAAQSAMPVPPARAFSQASFPLVSNGSRGVDVQALQYLLRTKGYSLSADGVFGSGTLSAVKAWQARAGLSSDGVVGAQTWGSLTPTLRQGSTGDAVRALQVELNRKRGAGLVVDGRFGDGTHNAVVAFQRHAGISPDGVVGDTTWRNLVWHFVNLSSSSSMCDQNPDGNAYANWGTAATIAQLQAAADSFASTGQGRVPFGDISNEHGGDIAGHASHELGVDADVWPIRTDNAQCTAGRITWQSSAYDRAATRVLVQKIRAAAPGHVALVYFNDPVLISEGLVTAYPNHDNHLHVRYR